MYQRIKRLFSESSVYTLGNVLLRSFSTVTMPVFTRCMTPGQYGILSIVRTIRELFNVVYDAGSSESSMRFYYECRTSREEKRLFSSLFFFTSGFGILLSIFLLVLGEPLWDRVIKDIPFHPYGALTVFTVLMTTIGILPKNLFRAKGKAKRFVVLNLLQASLIVGLSLLLVVVYDMGAMGPIVATLAVSILFSFIYLYYLWPYLSFTFSWKRVIKSLSFGLPGTPVRIGNWALKMVNQIILQYHVSLSRVAIYSVGYSVGSIFAELVMTGFQSAVLPFYYETVKEEPEERAKQIFSYVAAYTLVLILFISLFTILMGNVLVVLFASSKYADAEPIVTAIAISSLFQFLFYVPARGIYIMKKTVYLLPLLFVTVGVNVSISLLFIPAYGVAAAAWATLIAYFVRAVLTLILSQRVYWIPYHYMRMGKSIFVFLMLVMAGSHLPDWPMYIQIPARLTIIMAFPLVLYVFGFFEKGEIARLRSGQRALSKRLMSAFSASGAS